jgi:hypothetical protein
LWHKIEVDGESSADSSTPQGRRGRLRRRRRRRRRRRNNLKIIIVQKLNITTMILRVLCGCEA